MLPRKSRVQQKGIYSNADEFNSTKTSLTLAQGGPSLCGSPYTWYPFSLPNAIRHRLSHLLTHYLHNLPPTCNLHPAPNGQIFELLSPVRNQRRTSLEGL